MSQSDALRDYAISKAQHLERYFDGIISVEVTLDMEKERRSVQVFCHLINKKIVKASAETDDMYASIDEAMDKATRQLKKYKEKLKDKSKDDDLVEEDSGVQGVVSGEEKEIIKTDIYFKKPMSPEEAALQLDAYQEDFLVFLNSDDDRLNIIYHRDDGNYGLIEPQLNSY